VALAVALVGWSFVTPRIPTRWRLPVQAGVGGLLVLATRAAVGLKPPRLWAGLGLGLPAAATVATTVAASTAVPAVRVAMSTRDVPESAVGWLVLRIPLGTVWAEEAAFRAALPAAAGAFGQSGARLLQAVTFGMSHISDARGTGEPVVPTVLVTGVAGWLFGWLADRSGSLAAPMLAHLAVNEAGASAVLAVRRHLAPGL
jgi:membrane protease YdiL (CAAX protease family)